MRYEGNGNGSRRPDEILAEIDRTRGELDSTLSAIEHRLTPGQLVDQGLDYLRNSGGTEFVKNLGTSAKQNPLPVALVGIGLAWLMATNKRPGTATLAGTDAAQERISATAHSAMDTLGSTAQAARERASQLGESARQLGQSARHQVQRARSNVDYLVNEQPLALGAIGLAIGAVLAAAAPRTRQEDELMGETRERLAKKATEAGAEKAKQVMETAREAMAGQHPQKPAGGTPRRQG